MANGGAGAGRDVKDNFVPRFENTTVGYTEWRRRVKLYARKLELQGRKNEVALNALSVLEGPSWTQCEDLDIQELEKENGLDILLKRLDKHGPMTQRSKCRPTSMPFLQDEAQEGSVHPRVHHGVPPGLETGRKAQSRPTRRSHRLADVEKGRFDP